MFVNGQLESAQFELYTTGTLPAANTKPYQAVYLTDTNRFLISDGVSWTSPSPTPVGSIIPFAGGALSVPADFLLCDGSEVDRTTYASLYAVINDAYGEGDGSTTFNVPDFRGHFLRGHIPILGGTCTGSASSDIVNLASHGFIRNGIQVRVTGTPVTGLSTSTTYFAIIVSTGQISFATTRANALAGTAIAISGSAAAMGVQQWVDPDATLREALNIGGNTGSNIGSIEDDETGPHFHTLPYGSVQRQDGGGNTIQAAAGTISTAINSGTESRPKNVFVNYIIKT